MPSHLISNASISYTKLRELMVKIFLFVWIGLLLPSKSGLAQSASVFPHRGKLIIIGGGTIPDTLFQLFAT